MEFILSDYSLNSHGVRVSTKGIRMESFINNPVMLYNHNMNKVMGKWTDLSKRDGKLYGTAEFDDSDPEAIKVRKKVEKNYIKGASIGISINKVEEIEGEYVITDSELFEGSVTPLPSNKNALKLTYKDKTMVLNGEKTKDEVKMFFSLEQDNEPVVEEEVEAIEETVEEVATIENVEEVSEEIIEDPAEEVATEEVETVEETTEDNSEVEDNVDNEVTITGSTENIELSVEDLNTRVLTLQVELETLTNTIKAKDETLLNLTNANKDLTSQLEKYESKEKEEFINDAIRKGKFNIAQKESLLSLATKDFNIVKDLADKAVLKPNIKLSDNLVTEDADPKSNWTFMDWQKRDPQGLKLMKETNKDGYQRLYKDWKRSESN